MGFLVFGSTVTASRGQVPGGVDNMYIRIVKMIGDPGRVDQRISIYI